MPIQQVSTCLRSIDRMDGVIDAVAANARQCDEDRTRLHRATVAGDIAYGYGRYFLARAEPGQQIRQ